MKYTPPDKIFIHKKDLSYSEVKESDSDITFIRKDALLEWAKETYLNEKASAIRKVCYKQLIDKIESL